MSTRVAVLAIAVLVFLSSSPANGRSREEWKSRIIYQVSKLQGMDTLATCLNVHVRVRFEFSILQVLTDRFAKTSSDGSPCSDIRDYCGGSFQGIIDKLDYIQGLGVNAIWISPIPEQTDKGFHGYWQKNISNINPHFGSSSDLKKLVAACHSRGIWVMLDV